MKAISIKEPWATLIFTSGKDVENRTWFTSYRGPLVICASKSVDLYKDTRSPGNCYQEDWDNLRNYLTQRGVDGLPERFSDLGINPGYALGIVEVKGCHPNSLTRLQGNSWAMPGQYGISLQNPHPFKTPFPVRGQLGIFDLDVDRAWLEVTG